MANTNAVLNKAGVNKKDEFYTQLTDIEKEMRYYRDYLIMALLTVFCCAAAYILSGLVTISNKWLSFAVRMMISACLPNLVLYVLFRRTNEYVFVKTTAVKIVNKVINRKRKSAG